MHTSDMDTYRIFTFGIGNTHKLTSIFSSGHRRTTYGHLSAADPNRMIKRFISNYIYPFPRREQLMDGQKTTESVIRLRIKSADIVKANYANHRAASSSIYLYLKLNFIKVTSRSHFLLSNHYSIVKNITTVFSHKRPDISTYTCTIMAYIRNNTMYETSLINGMLLVDPS